MSGHPETCHRRTCEYQFSSVSAHGTHSLNCDGSEAYFGFVLITGALQLREENPFSPCLPENWLAP